MGEKAEGNTQLNNARELCRLVNKRGEEMITWKVFKEKAKEKGIPAFIQGDIQNEANTELSVVVVLTDEDKVERAYLNTLES